MTSRSWALPILFRLYRNERECTKRGDPYRKKTELARAMLDELLSWTELPVRVVADVAYCNATLQRGHDARVVFVGTMRPDSALTALPTAAERKKTGRRRVKGSVLPKPEALASSTQSRWQPVRATLYGKERVVHIKTTRAQWYIACGAGLLHVVLVRLDHGRIPFPNLLLLRP
jgi:hypothetical protein